LSFPTSPAPDSSRDTGSNRTRSLSYRRLSELFR
jgi:hypothetical protein